MKTNKAVRKRLKAVGVQAEDAPKWKPEMVDKICFVCGGGFDPDGPAPRQVVKPGTKDASRYYPLGAYTHQTHVAGSNEWYLNLDPRDPRDKEFVTYYESTYGPHPGRPKSGTPWRVRLSMLTLSVSDAPAEARAEANVEPDTRPMPGRPVRRASALSSAPGANAGQRVETGRVAMERPLVKQVEKVKVDAPQVAAVTAGLNGRSLKELEKIAKLNGMEAEWKSKWSTMPNPGMVRMQMGNVLRNRAKKGIEIHLL